MNAETFGTVSQDNLDGLAWRTAAQSDVANCVEVAPGVQAVWVRDSKNPEGGTQAYGNLAFATFIAQLKQTEFSGIVHV